MGAGLESPRLWMVIASLVASGCSAGESPEPEQAAPLDSGGLPDQGCLLGLGLWDTDPALTWIEDGKVWVRAGTHQACLEQTGASQLSWSPDGRRALLDDQIVEEGTVWPVPAEALPVVWAQPLGLGLLVLENDGAAIRLIPSPVVEVDSTDTVIIPSEVPPIAIASHPDAEHFAIVDQNGKVFLAAKAGGRVELFSLEGGERIAQLEFSADGSRLWALVREGEYSEARFVDLTPVTGVLDLLPQSSLVAVIPEPETSLPELRYLDIDLSDSAFDLDWEVGIGAVGTAATAFVLHPAHPDWLVLTEGSCSEATSSLHMDGRSRVTDLPGAGVGFFRGQGNPILATTTSGPTCGPGGLWVTTGPSGLVLGTPVLVSDRVSSAAIRAEAGDPWNPQSDPPFA